MKVESYLFFEGRCEEALGFYQKALGAKVGMVMKYKDSPVPVGQKPAGAEEKVLHASFTVGETRVMASDGHCSGKAEFKGFSLSITAKDEAEAERLFKAVGEGGEVRMPLGKTFFSSKFGMVTDKFGVMWMVLVDKQ